jgi:capsular polysaccharide biosynthesis protein
MSALSLMKISCPIRAVTASVRVGELILAPQAMGAGDLMGGSPEFRRFVRQRLGARRDPSLPRRLYISRSRNRPERGSILGEKRLEAFLADEGYAIFHPQDHDLASQAAHYASAEAIVGPDGSPFHLVAYAGAVPTRVAVLKRRPGPEWTMLADHLRRFGLKQVIAVEGRGGWSPGGVRRADLSVRGEISFAAAHAALLAGGSSGDPDPGPI